MRAAPRPLESASRRGGRVFRFHLWHGMVASLVIALGFWGDATLGPMVWVLPLIAGLIVLCGFLAILPFYLVVAILCQLDQDEPLPNRDE